MPVRISSWITAASKIATSVADLSRDVTARHDRDFMALENRLQAPAPVNIAANELQSAQIAAAYAGSKFPVAFIFWSSRRQSMAANTESPRSATVIAPQMDPSTT